MSRLIREPMEVDFYVIDKPWTDKEKKEFSEFIKHRKEKLKEPKQRTAKSKSELKKEIAI